MKSYFDTKSIADRYKKGRPYFHNDIISQIKNYLGLTARLEKALDVACGTGLSTKALLEIATRVDATDISAEMLNYAYRHECITYTKATAEERLFEPDSFDIITVSSGIHWFDIERFLAESNRVLKPDQWLIIYDSFFSGEMLGAETFHNWYSVTYAEKFPPPARNNSYNWSNENLSTKNFTLVNEQQLSYNIEFTIEQLVLYLTTQSNITAQVEQGGTSYEDVEKWLYQQLEPFFATEKATLFFGGWIKYLQNGK